MIEFVKPKTNGHPKHKTPVKVHERLKARHTRKEEIEERNQ